VNAACSDSQCVSDDESCDDDGQCCSGTCPFGENATLGTCQVVPASGAGGCLSAGEVCGGEFPKLICGGECVDVGGVCTITAKPST